MGSCHGTFLATPARQGFSEATRDRTVGCPPRSPSLRGRRAEAPRRAGRAQRPSPGEGEAGPAARSPAAPGGGGSRRGAAPGLRPGKCGGGGRQEEEKEEEGGVGGQRIDRVQLPACPNACAYPRRMPVLSPAHSALRCPPTCPPGLFTSAAIRKQWQAGCFRLGSSGDGK